MGDGGEICKGDAFFAALFQVDGLGLQLQLRFGLGAGFPAELFGGRLDLFAREELWMVILKLLEFVHGTFVVPAFHQGLDCREAIGGFLGLTLLGVPPEGAE